MKTIKRSNELLWVLGVLFVALGVAVCSKANLAMVPLQDYLNLSNEEGRMNIPATADGNWAWRVSSRYNTPQLRSKILSLVTKTKRNK